VLGIQNGCDLTEQEKEMIEKFEVLIKAHR